MSDHEPGAFIFQDPLGRRWPRLRRVLLALVVMVAIATVWFFRTLLIHPELKTPASVIPLKKQLKAAIQRTEEDDPNAINWEKYYRQSQTAQERQSGTRKQTRKPPGAKGEVRLGYYV